MLKCKFFFSILTVLYLFSFANWEAHEALKLQMILEKQTLSFSKAGFNLSISQSRKLIF